MSDDSGDRCALCGGTGHFPSEKSTCVYCNGEGTWNQAADAYVKNHICQCIYLDRVFCPVCNLKCHHDASTSPKQIIDSGFGGMSNVYPAPDKEEEEEEIEIIA